MTGTARVPTRRGCWPYEESSKPAGSGGKWGRSYLGKVLENLRVGFGLRVFCLQDVTGSGLGDGSCLWTEQKPSEGVLVVTWKHPKAQKFRQDLHILPYPSLAPTQSPSEALTLQFPALVGFCPHRWGGTWRLKAVIWGTCKSSGWDLRARHSRFPVGFRPCPIFLRWF